MNITIVRVLISVIYGLAFGWISRSFGLSATEMTALLFLSIAWLIINMVINSNRVRSTPSVSTDRLEDDRND